MSKKRKQHTAKFKAIDWTDILGQKISPEVCSAWAEKKVKPWLKGKQELGDAVYDALLDRYFEEAIVTSITIINPGGMVNRKELGRTAVSEKTCKEIYSGCCKCTQNFIVEFINVCYVYASYEAQFFLLSSGGILTGDHIGQIPIQRFTAERKDAEPDVDWFTETSYEGSNCHSPGSIGWTGSVCSR